MSASLSPSAPSPLVYRLRPPWSGSLPACAMGAGVSKSGSPAPRLITSLPCCRRRAARALTASVGEGLTRWTRRATGKVTEFPAFRLRSGRPAILRDCVRPGHRESIRVEQQPFKLEADYAPAGDQPQAIEKLVEGLAEGLAHQTLLGVTGSGKTYSAAAVIQRVQRPTMVLAHNKTLAAQLYGEFREFFPHNAVEYFVSYYDYYQPEAYVPSSDTYIEKDSSINDEIDRLRHSATSALMSRRDVIIVASLSAIYGLGSPELYEQQCLMLGVGEEHDQRAILRRLVELQYERNDEGFVRNKFRVRGDSIEVFPAYEERGVRIQLFGDEIERMYSVDALTGEIVEELDRFVLFPASHYVTDEDHMQRAIEGIEAELEDRLAWFESKGKLLEAQRLRMRTTYDLEMLREIGTCSGIENYSRFLDRRQAGQMPYTP